MNGLQTLEAVWLIDGGLTGGFVFELKTYSGTVGFFDYQKMNDSFALEIEIEVDIEIEIRFCKKILKFKCWCWLNALKQNFKGEC